jgi:hypothetical protein
MNNKVDPMLRKLASFDSMWREDLSFLPGIPMDWKEREQWKVIAEKIYNRILNNLHLGKLLDEAYDNGYAEGLDDGEADS